MTERDIESQMDTVYKLSSGTLGIVRALLSIVTLGWIVRTGG